LSLRLNLKMQNMQNDKICSLKISTSCIFLITNCMSSLRKMVHWQKLPRSLSQRNGVSLPSLDLNLPFHLFIYLFIYSFIFYLIYLSIYIFIYPFISFIHIHVLIFFHVIIVRRYTLLFNHKILRINDTNKLFLKIMKITTKILFIWII
jgi:hypothetical protein